MNNLKLGIIGYGSFGKQIESYLVSKYSNIELMYFDDFEKDCKRTKAFWDYCHYFKDISKFFIGLGYKNLKLKNKIINSIDDKKLESYFHNSSFISETTDIGNGCFIFPNVTIDNDVIIGQGVVLNISTTICHNSKIGDCTFIAPNVTVCGEVVVGRNCFIGAGAVIANGLVIGDNVTVGAGSIVTKDLKDEINVIGNPLKTIENLNLK
jgi:sugar O-acyltransferase (sialic acid O-acetyltransferase NeuD family)